MSDANQKLTELAKEFMEKLRKQLSQSAGDEPEQFAERLLGIGATLAAAVMMVLPAGRREKLIAALLSAALRHFAQRPKPARIMEVIDGG